VICPQGMLVFQIVRSDLEKKKALSEKNLASFRGFAVQEFLSLMEMRMQLSSNVS
jgi:hypothetical protein